MTHTRCMLDKLGYKHAHAHAHKHARTDKYVILIAFRGNNGFANAPQCCVIRTLPVLFVIQRFENAEAFNCGR
jgi:hypothetical protein